MSVAIFVLISLAFLIWYLLTSKHEESINIVDARESLLKVQRENMAKKELLYKQRKAQMQHGTTTSHISRREADRRRSDSTYVDTSSSMDSFSDSSSSDSSSCDSGSSDGGGSCD